MNQSWLDKVGANPTRAILAVYWIMQATVGFLIVSPFYMAEDNTPSLAATLLSLTLLKLYGAILLLPGIAGLLYLKNPQWKKSDKVVRGLTFWSFLIFTYFTMARLVIFGPGQVIWMAYGLCAITMGIVYVRLKWEDS